MNNYIVRLCKEDDIRSICKLQDNWYKEDITYGFVAGDSEYLLTKLGDYFFVAEIDGTIIGFAYGTIHEAADMSIFPDGTRYIEIDDIYMDSVHRGTGVGGILLDNVLEAARKNGIDRSLVYSATKDSDKILNFYKAHGYKTWFIQMFK